MFPYTVSHPVSKASFCVPVPPLLSSNECYPYHYLHLGVSRNPFPNLTIQAKFWFAGGVGHVVSLSDSYHEGMLGRDPRMRSKDFLSCCARQPIVLVYMYLCMNVCMYVCMYVCTYVCIHVHMYMHMYVHMYVPT